MPPENFILWLQGFIDAGGPTLDAEQVATIKAKISEVHMRGAFSVRDRTGQPSPADARRPDRLRG